MKPLADALRTCSSSNLPSDGRIRDREAAAATLRQHDVEILPGHEAEFFDRGQPQEHRHDVVGQALHAVDAARQALHLDIGSRPNLAGLDDHVGHWPGLAQQHIMLPRLLRGDARGQPEAPDTGTNPR